MTGPMHMRYLVRDVDEQVTLDLTVYSIAPTEPPLVRCLTPYGVIPE